jgi:tRNA nucleotidyltransferase (CCA-adding enzyme)
MEIYLVGGAVRDKLLGLEVTERDWVVVGATPDEMLARGYTPVGKGFPVFLHPETKEEYALARTERKTGPGYTGFETCAEPTVTLEQDLQRRDLTINAMAETKDGALIDPYGGEEDLRKRLLKHVSPAFSEDPVRILRAARFAARFTHLGFHLSHETNRLMCEMVARGEVDHLVPERVRAELAKTLQTQTPSRFFDVLHGCGALAILFPEMQITTPDETSHIENRHALDVLEAAASLSESPVIRFAAFICDLDNGNPNGLTESQLSAMCSRHRIPNEYCELATLALRHHSKVNVPEAGRAEDIMALLLSVDALRRPERLENFLTVCTADATAHGQRDHTERLRRALAAAKSVDTEKLRQQGLSGQALGDALQQARIEAVKNIYL